MWILIESGDIFEGNEDHLDDCFGIRPDELAHWCDENGWTHEVRESQTVTVTYQTNGTQDLNERLDQLNHELKHVQGASEVGLVYVSHKLS